MELLILFGTFTTLLLIGTPVAFCLGVSSFATIVYLGLPPVVVFQVQQVALRPVKVIGDKGDLFEQQIERVTYDPRASSAGTPACAGGALAFFGPLPSSWLISL